MKPVRTLTLKKKKKKEKSLKENICVLKMRSSKPRPWREETEFANEVH